MYRGNDQKRRPLKGYVLEADDSAETPEARALKIVIYNRSLLMYNRSLLIYNRSLLIYNRFLFIYNRSLFIYNRSLFI